MFRFTNLIIFELTRDCNLRCKYCYMLEKHKYKGEIIDFELFKKIIDRITEQRIINHREDERLQLNFHGGECTLVGKENFKRILEYTKKTFGEAGLSYDLGIQTNGTLLDEEFIDIFRHYNVAIGFSFDGNTEKSPLRFNEDTQNIVYNNLKKALEKKIGVGVLSVLSRNNYKSVATDELELAKLGLRSHKINYIEDMENPYNSKIELSGMEIWKKVELPLLKNFLKTGELIEYHTKLLLETILLDIITDHPQRFETGCSGKICGAGMTMIAVRPDGTMGYCDRYSRDFSENYIEHALDYDFLGLHQINKAVKLAVTKHYLLKSTGCDHCRASYICENGCLAFYYSKFGIYGIQKNLLCDQYLNFYDWVEKHLFKILQVYKSVGRKIDLTLTNAYDIKPKYQDLCYKKGINLFIEGTKLVIKDVSNV